MRSSGSERAIFLNCFLWLAFHASAGAVNPLWEDAQQHGNNWLSLKWYGFFHEEQSGWIYHVEHGFQFTAIGTGAGGRLLADPSLGGTWFWTREDVYPFMYRIGYDPAWFQYVRGGSPGNRRYFRLPDGLILQEPEMMPAIPEAPSNFTISNVTYYGARLTWQDNSTNESHFEVGEHLNSVFIPKAVLAANTTQYDLGGLSPSTTYFYEVRAVNQLGSAGTGSKAFRTASSGPEVVEIYASVNKTLTDGDSPFTDDFLSSGELAIGDRDYQYGTVTYNVTYSTALWFDINPYVEGRDIKSATLELWATETPDDSGDNGYEVCAFILSWDGASITHENMPDCYSTQTATVFNFFSTTSPIQWDVTGIVSRWANGSWGNYGLLLQSIFSQVIILESLEQYTDPDHRPKLVIEFY